MKINVLTLFPDMFTPLQVSMLARGLEDKKWDLNLVNFRDLTTDVHHHVDDTPYGGGAGMVLQIMPIKKALDSLPSTGKIIITAPQGKTFNEKMAQDWAKEDELTFICGHYEGFDDRIRSICDMEISIGDYVLTGGEIPAMVLIDSVTRLIDGVINKESYQNDSFYNGLLDYPQYTKPREYNGLKVPDVLLSGNHKEIEKYRMEAALEKTRDRRCDLLKENVSDGNL